jgi:hypothetical protein
MRNSGLIVSSILRMEVNRAIILRHDYFTIIIRQNLELDYFAIETPEAFEWKFGSVVYLYLRCVDAGCHNVPFIPGDLDLVSGDFELKVLDELYPPAILLIVTKGFAWFLSLGQELRVGFTCRHVVCLHSIDLCDFVHQQSIIITNILNCTIIDRWNDRKTKMNISGIDD